MGKDIDDDLNSVLTCGDFSCATGWIILGGWTIAGGAAHFLGPPPGHTAMYQNIGTMIVGNVYKIEGVISNWTTGAPLPQLEIRLGGDQVLPNVVGNGPFIRTGEYQAGVNRLTLNGAFFEEGGSFDLDDIVLTGLTSHVIERLGIGIGTGGKQEQYTLGGDQYSVIIANRNGKSNLGMKLWF